MSPVSLLSDTSGDAEERWGQCFRSMSANEKWALLNDMFKAAKILHAAGVRLRNPQCGDAVVRREWLRATVDPDLSSLAHPQP